MMKQEDILRELELLPVWQSRTTSTTQQIEPQEAKTELPQATSEAASDAVNAPIQTKPADVFRCVLSQDAQWLFVLKSTHSAEAEALFHNMLRAVSVRVGQVVEQADIATLSQLSPKVIVVMGEEVAQQLLALTQPLAALRGQPQILNEKAVIATYSPEDLLQNSTDKSKAWEDLCLAKFTIANL